MYENTNFTVVAGTRTYNVRVFQMSGAHDFMWTAADAQLVMPTVRINQIAAASIVEAVAKVRELVIAQGLARDAQEAEQAALASNEREQQLEAARQLLRAAGELA